MLGLSVGVIFFLKMLLLSGLVTKVCKICVDLRRRKEILLSADTKGTDLFLVILDDPSFGMAQDMLMWPCLILLSFLSSQEKHCGSFKVQKLVYQKTFFSVTI